ncbi:MAG: N-acetyltransferase [Dysgonomonas sp.]|nr:N-acetyltransferase [Dysgonomonas sp.]
MKNSSFNIDIREENANDFPAVYNVHFTAFGRNDEARLTDRLRLSKAFIPQLSLVAQTDNKIVGHILFTKITISNDVDGGATESLSLAPVAVVPEMQRQGIGAMLIRRGLEIARELGYKSVIVLGHKDYYPRFGFISTQKWQIKPPFNVPKETFMGLELIDGSLSDVAGVVKYADEFLAI